MIKYLLFIFLLLSAPMLPAQHSVEDSVRVALKSCSRLLYENPDSALIWGFTAASVADRSGVDSLKCDAHRMIGNAYFVLSQFDNALTHYLQSLEIADKLGHASHKAGTLGNIGGVYFMMNLPEKALEYYKESLKLGRERGSIEQIATAYHNIGMIYDGEERYQEALVYYHKGLELLNKQQDSVTLAGYFLNIANIHRELGQKQDAEKYYKKCIEYRKTGNDLYGLADTYVDYADYFHRLGSDSAIVYSELAYDISRKLNSFFLQSKASKMLYVYYESEGNYEKALKYFTEYFNAHDSIRSQEVVEKEARYNFSRRQKELEVIQARREETQKAALVQARIIRNVSFSGVLVLGGFLGFVVMAYRRNRKLNYRLRETNKIIDHKNREITDSIRYARKLQEAILPSEQLRSELIPDSFVFYLPKDIVAGDFYLMESVSGSKGEEVIIIAAADCTGHGVPGAMLSMVCSNALNRAIREYALIHPAEILDKVSALVEETFIKSSFEVRDGMDISIAAFYPASGRLEWAGANNPLWIYSSGQWVVVKGDKQPVGHFENRKPFTNHIIELQKDDQFFLFTDGYADQFGFDSGKKLKYRPFRELLTANLLRSPADQKKELEKFFVAWKGRADQVDDVCVIGVKV